MNKTRLATTSLVTAVQDTHKSVATLLDTVVQDTHKREDCLQWPHKMTEVSRRLTWSCGTLRLQTFRVTSTWWKETLVLTDTSWWTQTGNVRVLKGKKTSFYWSVFRSGKKTQYELVELAAHVQTADKFTRATAGGKLQVIAEQLKHLQDQARKVLEDARLNALIHKTACNFKKVPGTTYYVYKNRRNPDTEFISMISPEVG